MKLSEQKRLQIVTAAEALFSEHGVAATSMDQIAARAEVSKRTVYNHFATKADLFAAMLEAMFAKVDQGEILAYAPGESIHAQLTAIAQQEIGLLTSPAFLKVARVAFLQMLTDASLAKMINKSSMGCLRYFSVFLQAAVDDGVLAIDDLELASKQFVFQLKSLVFYPLLYGLSDSVSNTDYLVEESVKLFLARYAIR
ncbi:TetR/AcrR family transcriptional regulator [Gilvimarinus sp. SDUM040013]|uniref:TetR/AcrR family transcriptional regulator n=1 Tax=Gilvimarinus gilvus TaxID=3058038 RepID=A0ABU4RZ90_9GAMM|nr:TetR/AcrR family transcriptional regulator [Gilvimarinus sp. SDUM040013]MDO3384641.1 TetR/AcrR family transcriptional regulator [Gilvimarinus sp. SDUM040013]MDX6850227.1 TetR/AcrR family transcriptional regulator [Gilvimarinus sp. SDUM040013]